MKSTLVRITALLILLVYLVLQTSRVIQIAIQSNDRTLVSLVLNDIDCNKVFDGDEAEAVAAKHLEFNGSGIVDAILENKNSCDAIKRWFDFFPILSEEEHRFPLAYSMLVHKDVTQVMMLLSAIYQPQNQFCVAVDGNADETFWQVLKAVSHCYPNIRVLRAKRIEWCSYEIIEAIFGCVMRLAKSTADWKYMQSLYIDDIGDLCFEVAHEHEIDNMKMTVLFGTRSGNNRRAGSELILSGVDAPLKTNLEMVRILTALNGSFNTEIAPFEWYRLNRKRMKDSPLPIIKSSLAATFSREAAKFMAENKMVQEQFRFLKGTSCADESLWGTIAGNPGLLPMPGGFDGRDFLWRKYGGTIDKRRRVHGDPWTAPPILTSSPQSWSGISGNVVYSYAISRYQQWMINTNSLCRGRYYRLSCIYGVDDLPVLVRRSELMAHKLYLDFQPAAFFCLIKEARRRSLQPVPFSATLYTNLPDTPHRNKF